jgi:pimeloyl-ACP methyl ester carboxylesterase
MSKLSRTLRASSAGVVAALLWAAPGAAAESGNPAGAGHPEPDCRAFVAYDRNHEMPGYVVANPDGSKACVPFLVTAARPPAGYEGKDFYVEEFTDAKLKARWEACKGDPACHERLKPQIARWLPPNQARATRATGAVEPFGKIDATATAVDLRQIRRPGFFGKAPYNEAVAQAEPHAWTVEFTAPRDTFERLKLNMQDEIKLRGWYVEGAGVDDGAGRKVRALVVMSPGGGGQLTAIQHPADVAYTVEPGTKKIVPTRFPNATTEGFGQAQWRQYLYDFNRAGFDVLSYDRRGEGISGGFSDTNTLEQGEDIFRALDQLETGRGLRLLGPSGERLEGSAAAGKLLAGQRASELPVILVGYSRGSMATGWAMQKNFVESCTYDLPAVTCGPAKGRTNIKGAIMIASFGSGAGYLPDSPDLTDRNLFLGAMAADHNIVFYPNSAMLAGMEKWPAAVFAKGLWDRAESLEGTVAAYNRVKGPKEIVVARGPHGLDTWTPEMLEHLGSRMMAFGKAVALGRPEIEGQRTWRTLKELVATSPDSWEPSSKPAQ